MEQVSQWVKMMATNPYMTSVTVMSTMLSEQISAQGISLEHAKYELFKYLAEFECHAVDEIIVECGIHVNAMNSSKFKQLEAALQYARTGTIEALGDQIYPYSVVTDNDGIHRYATLRELCDGEGWVLRDIRFNGQFVPAFNIETID